MSKDIFRDYLKDQKKLAGKKYIANVSTDCRRYGLSPAEYGGFLDKKRTKTK